eukprot:scaffold27951_cov129-Isochrysis_galbana.AAC.2
MDRGARRVSKLGGWMGGCAWRRPSLPRRWRQWGGSVRVASFHGLRRSHPLASAYIFTARVIFSGVAGVSRSRRRPV